MRAENISEAAILAFKNSYSALVAGETGMIPEDSIRPANNVPSLDDIAKRTQARPELLDETVVLKLNGGLGTSMGLEKAKSLLPVKDGNTFLDLIAQQVLKLREATGKQVRFMLMNSFNTSGDTLAFLRQRYPELAGDPGLELLQNKVPKVDAETLRPAAWAARGGGALEWCPPGHGDLYAALHGSGRLDELLAAGVKYMFVSNSDNLGATLDPRLLTWFADSGKPFLMECCERTAADKKGGHLAVRRRDGRFVLRESAQCAAEDEGAFQDVDRHRYFNTNNLWVRLDKLKEELERAGGLIPLPMIKNAKTVDPQDGNSPKVFQLETAMGAAIECFAGAGAVAVPRARFAPVKKCSDLFLLRSDAYVTTDHATLVLNPQLNGACPLVELDPKVYKLVQGLDRLTRNGTPSMVLCSRLTVNGKVKFADPAATSLSGAVTLTNTDDNGWAKLEAGEYADGTEIDISGQRINCIESTMDTCSLM